MSPGSEPRLNPIDAKQRRQDRIHAIFRDHAAADGPRRLLPARTKSILTDLLNELANDERTVWVRRFGDAGITLQE